MEQKQISSGDKPSLEEILRELGEKEEFDDKFRYLMGILKKEERLDSKLILIDNIPRVGAGKEIRIKAEEEVLREILGGQKFEDLYGICYLGSKEKHPKGYHVYAKEGKSAPINPEHFPVDLATDLLGGVLMPCYYHHIGFIAGAIARNKPYEVLPFKPSQELQQIVESATQEYKIVIRQNPRQNDKIKPEEGIVAVVIFEDRGLYTDPLKREAVVNYLQEAESAVLLYKNEQISKEELDAIVRMRLRLTEKEKATTEQISQPLEGPYQREVYPLLINLEDPEWVKEINSIATRYKQGYQVTIISAKEGLLGATFDEEFTREKLKEKLEKTFEDVEWQIGRIKNLIQTGVLQGQIETILDQQYGLHQQQSRVVKEGPYEIDYVPSSPGRIEDINFLLEGLRYMLKTPFSFRYTEEGKHAKVDLGGEATQQYFNGIAPLAQRLDVIIGMWRNDSTKGAEMTKGILEAFGAFGQQQQ